MEEKARILSDSTNALSRPSLLALETVGDLHFALSKTVEEILQKRGEAERLALALKGFLEASKAAGNSQPG